MRLPAARVSIVIVVLLVAAVAEARPGGGGGGGRPSMGRVGGGAARPSMPAARPATPMARPQMATPRPQMPMARPSMPAAASRPSMPNMQRPTGMPGGMARPQVPNFQRPSVGTVQRPNLARPSLPNAANRPQFTPPTAGIGSRPGLGTIRPTGPTNVPGMAGRPTPGSGVGATRPSPMPGRPGFNAGPGLASRPGGGFATKPAPLPGQIGGPGGGRPGGVSTLPGQVGNRPGIPTTKPSFPSPNFPGAGGGMAGGNRPGRPGLGEANRPTTLPGTIDGNRPGIGGGNRPGIGGNRPTTLPGDLGGNRPGGNRPDGNRPGMGGNRPGIGGNRPTTLPGDLGGNRPGGNRPDGNRPGWGGNRPGIGGNRPTTLPGDLGHWNGGNRPNRPGIGGNRPGIGNGNWNSGNWNNNHFNNINVGGGYGGWGWNGGGYGWNNGWNNGWHGGGYGGWGYPGYGGGYGWNNGWNNGWVNPHYGNWYNGGWGNNWGNNGGWWAPFVTGAATWGLLSSIGNWGLGYSSLGYGAAGYVNPYYSAMPAAVVASSPYDYSQPVIVNNYIPVETPAADAGTSAVPQPATPPQETAPAPSPADTAVDAALGKFKAGDYAGALAGFDQALKLSPKDSVIHEVRALSLFALGRYTEAAAALNAVLATAPGMDWTTMSNVYGSVDAYTGHLRTLEEFCRTHPDDAAAHFVLGYHYLVGGHTDMAAAALRVVVSKQPGDVVAKRLLDAITPPAEDQATTTPGATSTPASTEAGATAEKPLPDIDLVGTWKATSDKDTIMLTVTPESGFTWKAQPAGKPAVELKGTIETSADAIALVSESAGTMVAKVTPQTADSFEFALPSAPKDAKPLVFTRQP